MKFQFTRRGFLAGSVVAGMGCRWLEARQNAAADKALVAITLDMEMSRNFPTREITHWDYEKGNLNDQTKQYTSEACRRVKAAGGVLHCFAVGRVCEQESVAWLKEIDQAGHPIGNHTYDHVNVTARALHDIQARFQRAPWLIEGREPKDVIRENIRLCSAALKERIGIDAAGFRTPGGFRHGLADRPDIQQMLAELGFTWVSSKYPAHPVGEAGQEVTPAIYDGIIQAQSEAQPFVYPGGLIEVPMSPISDIGAFRTGRWKLAWYLKAIRLALESAIDQRATFDFLAHPSCLYVMDPEFKAIDLICDLVKKAGDKAALVDLATLAQRATHRA